MYFFNDSRVVGYFYMYTSVFSADKLLDLVQRCLPSGCLCSVQTVPLPPAALTRALSWQAMNLEECQLSCCWTSLFLSYVSVSFSLISQMKWLEIWLVLSEVLTNFTAPVVNYLFSWPLQVLLILFSVIRVKFWDFGRLALVADKDGLV